MGKISVKGVLIGGIVDVVASVVLGLPFAIYEMSQVDLSNTPPAQASRAVTAAVQANVPLYVAQLLVGLACSVLGGYVSAWVNTFGFWNTRRMAMLTCMCSSIVISLKPGYPMHGPQSAAGES